jgi:putative heme iron utilization protein
MPNAMTEKLISDILSQDDIMFSINSGSGICEARIEKNLPFRIREQWATIGYEDGSWHIHLNLEEIVEARFVRETRTNGMISFSIRFFDSKGNLAMRANFVKMYDKQGNIIQDRVAKYVDIFKKYGEEESVYLGRKRLNAEYTFAYI